MEPNNSVLAGLKLEFDVAEDPQQNCSYRPTDDARRCRGSDDPYNNHAALSEQSSGGGFRMFGLKVKLKMETPDPNLAEAEDPFTALNLQIKKKPLSNSGDEIFDKNATGSKHAEVSEQPSGSGFRIFGLKDKLKTETPDPDPSEAGDPFMGLNLPVKKEPVSGSGDETSDNDIEGCDVSDTDWHFKFVYDNLNFDNCERKTNNRKENNEVVIENQMSKGTNSPNGTKYFNSDAFKPRKLLSVEKKYHLALAQHTGEMLAGDRSLESKPSVEKVAAETQTRFAFSCGKNKQQHFDEEDTSSEHQEIMNKHLKCYLCGKVFTRSDNLKAHQRIHMGDKPFKCTVCSEAFFRSKALKRHQLFHRGEKPYQCTDCDKVFSEAQELKRHQLIHSGDKPYQCSDCDKAFIEPQGLKRHQRIHTGDKPYQCTECDKAFSDSSYLKKHQRIHTGDKPYHCTDCGKTFTQVQNLKTHQRIHKGDKPYQCTECDKAFVNLYHLKRHQRIHTGDKPYQCADCNKSFNQLHHLETHQRIHAGDKPYKCTECDKAFSDSSNLKKHQPIHSRDKPYHCTDCTKAFCQVHELKRHQHIHSGDKPYKCTECDKAYIDPLGLKRHQRIHTGDKPYQCTECDKAFNDLSNLKKHQKRIHTRDKSLSQV